MQEHDIAQRQALGFSVAPPWSSNAGPTAHRAASDASTGGVSCRLGDASCASAHAARVSRSALGDGAMLQRSLRRLQRDYGNQYVGQVLRQATSGHAEGGMEVIERSIGEARGGGHAMDHATCGRMESSFGADFSGVRIHTDARADGLSQSLSARAFTTGRDVFFRQGEYNPGASGGRELLAHELTHVVQQNGNGVQRKMTVSEPGDAHEVEADQMARQVMQQEHAVQRQPETPKRDEEEDKKKVHRQVEGATVSRQEDEQNQE